MVQDATPELSPACAQGALIGYAGFDPTAASLHIGNLAVIMLLVHFQRAGNKPIALVGGATGRVGDPSGKSQERRLLDLDELNYNQERIRLQLSAFLDFDAGAYRAEIVNNYTWYEHFRLLDFLRDVGKHLTINYMLSKDSVQNRLESGMSFTEFCYQLLQGYDYYYLHNAHGCSVQMGGSDQWGNITTGTELIRRMGGKTAHAVTCPLITKADGSKFGKSESGNVWLDPALTSPYKFYQFFLNVTDEEVPKLLKYFSLKDWEEIEALLSDHAARPGSRVGQKALAEELTARVHGETALRKALDASTVLFGGASNETLAALSETEFLEIFEGVPQARLTRTWLDGAPVGIDLLTEVGAAPSKSEARRLLQGGGVSVNKHKITDLARTFTKEDLLNNRFLLVQVGKKNYYIGIVE